MKKIHIIDSRPAIIPRDWKIINAPRPLWGNQTWRGEFRHGIFYAGLDPNDTNHEIDIKNADNLDAWELVYWTPDKAREHLKNDPKYRDYTTMIDEMDLAQLRQAFSYVMNEKNQ